MMMPIAVAWAVRVGEFARLALEPPAGSIALARPKSSTFTVPSARTLMLAGLRSRWTMLSSCAASSASAICFAIGNTSVSGIGPRAMIADRSSPSASSMTSARTGPDSSMPWIPAMLGWFSAASVCASRVKRTSRSASSAKTSGRTLIATSRLSFVSRARYTSPIPPAPMAPRISYEPRRVPEVSIKGDTWSGAHIRQSPLCMS